MKTNKIEVKSNDNVLQALTDAMKLPNVFITKEGAKMLLSLNINKAQ